MIKRQKDNLERSMGWAMSLIWVLMYVLGTLFVCLRPIPFFLKFQPFRSTDIYLLLFFLWFSRDILRGLTTGSLTDRLVHFGLFILLFFFNLMTLPSAFKDTLTLIWVLLTFIKVSKEWRPLQRMGCEGERVIRALVWGGSIYALLLLGLVNYWSLRMGFSHLLLFESRSWLWTNGALFVFVAYLAQRLESLRFECSEGRLRVATLILCCLLVLEAAERVAGMAVHRYRQTGHLIYEWYHPLFYDAAHWCRDNTPPDALIVIPPYMAGFRSESLRSVFASWDEQLALMIAPDYLPEYDRRLRMLGIRPLLEQDPASTWRPTQGQLLQVRDQYQADYIVIESHKQLLLPLVYSNPQYSIYRLQE